MKRAMVVCIGNALVADDGVGAAVYEALKAQSLSSDVRLTHIGVSAIDLLDHFNQEDICVFVDAATSIDAPGTIRIGPPCESISLGSALSAHDIGVADAIAIAQILYPERIPRVSVLVTVAGDCFNELRPTLSPRVEAAIPKAVDAVIQILRSSGVN